MIADIVKVLEILYNNNEIKISEVIG